MLVLVGSMLFIYFVSNPILVFWCIRQNPFPLIFRCLKKSAITAFFTRSSAANIPINMEACEEMGLDKDTYSVTIPLGATINMDGAAITITVMHWQLLIRWELRWIFRVQLFECAGNPGCLRSIWCGRRFPASDSDGMLTVRYSE